MDEREEVRALIERLVRDARTDDPGERDALRRELESHFAEAGGSPERVRALLERFGDPAEIGDGFRRAYRRGRWLLYAAKVVASVLASTAATVVIQLVATVGPRGAGSRWRLTSHPGDAVVVSLAVVLVAVAAWELGIEPLCARLERRPLHLALTFAALFAGIWTTHQSLDAAFGPERAFVATAWTVASWTTTLAILARLDLVFLRLLGPRDS